MESQQAARVCAWEEFGYLKELAAQLAGSAAGKASSAFGNLAERRGADDQLKGARVDTAQVQGTRGRRRKALGPS